MRIRTLLITVLALSFGLIAARLVVLEVRGQQSRQLDVVQLDVERMARDAASLLVLSQDYLLHESPRAAQQWHATHSGLRNTLPKVAAGATDLRGQAEDLAEVVSGLPEIFKGIESVAGGSNRGDVAGTDPRRQMLAQHMVGETRRISDGAFEMAETLVLMRQESARTERRVSWLTNASLGALILLLGWIVTRRVLQPMVQLELTAQAVQHGDLAARSGWQARDEFGSLSRVFDQMTQTLQFREATLAASNQHLLASQESLASAQRDLRNILDAVPSMIGYWDKDLVNRFANQAHHHWFGIDPTRLPGTHIKALLGEVLYAHNLPRMGAALRGETQDFLSTIPRPDGNGVRHALVHYVPDMAEGKARGFYELVHDISELTESREQLTAAQRDSEALLSTIRRHTIVSVADRSGRIVDANDGFCRISGYSREELLGQNHRIVNSGVHDADFWPAVWASISRGEPWRGEVCNRAKNGSLYWVDSMIVPFAGADGRVEKYISIRTDITPNKIAEQKLRDSEAFLDRAGEVAGVGCWELDLLNMSVTWSTQTSRIHEAEPDYRPSLEDGLSFYAPAARPAIEAAVTQGMTSGEGWDLELPMITAKGRAFWARTVGAVEFKHGKAVKMVGAIQDITARRQADALLQQAHDRFEIAADSAGMGVWEFDPRARAVVWDERMYRLYRRERSGTAEPYALWLDNLHADDRVRAAGLLEAALRGEADFEIEFRICWPDGEVRHLKASARVVRDAEGVAMRMTGVNIDITERKRAELKLLQTSSLLESVLESATEVSIIAADPHFKVTVFNAGAEKLLGYTRDEIIGPHPKVSDQPNKLFAAIHPNAARLVDGDTLRRERDWIYARKDGSSVPVSLVMTAMRDDGGKLMGYLAVARDVTRQKQIEESLREAMNKAEQASRAKTDFLANMSHEIRTPMNAVIGLSYLLRRTALDPDQTEMLSRIDLASRSLLAVINDVLDLSKIEAGEMSVECAAFNLRTLLCELSEVMAVPADAKGITLDVDTAAAWPQGLAEALNGDAARLRQILTNLLSNAIKFTERGRVTLRVLLLDAQADRVSLRFEVQDSGIGITPEAGARIFTPFAQADMSTTRRYGGTGLGLSIVKRLVQLMGGEVGFDSMPDIGSRFWVEMGFGIASADAITRETAPVAAIGRSLMGVRVLVVDDSDINLAVARRILELEGALVEVAANGLQAVGLLQAAPTAFDVVLMDVQMPVLDGHEATRRIRGQLGLRQLPIIALTAGALSSERQRATAAGMDDFITKPFHAKSLIRSVRLHVQRALQLANPGEVLAGPMPSVADMAAAPRHSTDGAAAFASAVVSAPVFTSPVPSPQAGTVAAAWPAIDGIDSAEVCSRLGGDVALYRLMLKQFCTEFADLARPDVSDIASQDAAQRAALAGRLHKLKGSAGNLGAKAIHRLADLAEMDCRVSTPDAAQRAPNWGPQLAAQLRQLRDAAAAVIDRPEPMPEPMHDDGLPLALDKLLDLLRGNRLEALGEFSALSEQLRQRMAPNLHHLLCEHMARLRFDDAAQLLADVPKLASA